VVGVIPDATGARVDRRPLVAGNWKMHGLSAEGAALAGRVTGVLADLFSARDRPVDVVLCPPFTGLQEVGRALAGSGVFLGAQNVHWEDKGAFTGEISAPMLLDLGCEYVIIGHSERRQHFGETDASVRRRLAAAARHNLRPILCVGETWEEREAGRTVERVTAQLHGALKGLGRETAPTGLAVAYEPVWAIGTGRAARGTDAQEVAALIRRLLGDLLGPELAVRTRVLYGGSVKPDNIDEFAGQADIDGALVGGASLDAEAFGAIVRRFAR
jgi:triosephosphate isomerase